jgi:hypothetical protein
MRAPVILISLTLCGLAANAADRDFKEIVRAIANEYHTEPTHIPLLGLISTVTFVARPGGTKQLDLAVFENLKTEGHDGAKVAARIREIVGASWKPFVEVRSRKKGKEEITLIYMRPEGHDFRMLITAIEHDEATVVQLKLNRAAIRRWLDNPIDEASDSIPGAEHPQP